MPKYPHSRNYEIGGDPKLVELDRFELRGYECLLLT